MPCRNGVLMKLKSSSTTLLSMIFPISTCLTGIWEGELLGILSTVGWVLHGRPVAHFTAVNNPIICNCQKKIPYKFLSLRLAFSAWFCHESTLYLRENVLHTLCLSFSGSEIGPGVVSCRRWGDSLSHRRWFLVNGVASGTWDVALDHLLWLKGGASQESSGKKKFHFFLF